MEEAAIIKRKVQALLDNAAFAHYQADPEASDMSYYETELTLNLNRSLRAISITLLWELL